MRTRRNRRKRIARGKRTETLFLKCVQSNCFFFNFFNFNFLMIFPETDKLFFKEIVEHFGLEIVIATCVVKNKVFGLKQSIQTEKKAKKKHMCFFFFVFFVKNRKWR